MKSCAIHLWIRRATQQKKGVKDESEGNRNNLAPWIRSKCIF
jgi:hypothetical protein